MMVRLEQHSICTVSIIVFGSAGGDPRLFSTAQDSVRENRTNTHHKLVYIRRHKNLNNWQNNCSLFWMSGTTGVSVTTPEMKINIRENIYRRQRLSLCLPIKCRESRKIQRFSHIFLHFSNVCFYFEESLNLVKNF